MASSILVHDRSVSRPYSGRVRKLDSQPAEDPVTAWEPYYRKYPADTAAGRRLRQSLAKQWLRDMAAAEAEIQERQAEHARITEAIARKQAEHELNMQCLVHFGVALDERGQFRTLLEETARKGHLTIREAAERAHRSVHRNGDSSVDGGVEPASGSG